MRWIRYRSGAGPRLGLVENDTISGLESPTSLLDLIANDDALQAAGERARNAPSEVINYEAASLLAPFIPTSIRDFACFIEHLKNAPLRDGSERPVDGVLSIYERIPCYYFGNPAAVIGPHDEVEIAPGSSKFDLELEVAAVIGRPGKNIPPHEADAHIAGYTIFCDWSARDHQALARPSGMGGQKGKDCANTIGPMFVTADELEPYRQDHSFDLEMTAYVNDELVGGGSLSQMAWSFGECISWASRGVPVRTGDIYGSGTVPTSCLLERSALDGEDFRGYLKPGDVVRMRVEKLGELRQTIVAGAAVIPLRTGY